MTLQAYIDNIKNKTGKSPDDFGALAKKAGLMGPGAKAAPLVAWLKSEFDLGHGHAMAIWHVFKLRGWVRPPRKARSAK